MNRPDNSRRMLIFDTAYTHSAMVERNLTALVCGRDLDGFFEHVWTVHPAASLFLPEDDPEKFGAHEQIELAPRHTLIEAKVGWTPKLRHLPFLNFALSQVHLLRWLLRMARRERISIVRAEDSWYNGLLALAVSRWLRLPLMIGVWGNPGEIRRRTGRPLMPRLFRKIWMEEAVERFILRRADAVVVLNEDNRQFVIDRGVPRERTHLFRIGNALADVHFSTPDSRTGGAEALRELGIEGEETLLCISRLEAVKMTDHVVRALGCLAERRPTAKLIISGDGTQRRPLERLAAELGLGDRVVFTGNRDQQWLAAVLPEVSVVVSPLTGRALAEAALGSAPVVAYDVDWQAEIVHPGETGELVPNQDYVALAAAVERMLADRPYARRLGKNLRRHTLALMDPSAAIEAQIAVYRMLLGDTDDEQLPARAPTGHQTSRTAR